MSEARAGLEKGPPPGAVTAAARERGGLVREMWRVLKQDKTALSGFFIILGLILLALSAPWLAPYDFSDQHILHAFKGPSAGFALGTDEFGRDILSRIMWGARPALLVGVLYR